MRDFKYGAQIELQRPTDAPGLEEDLRFALEQAQSALNVPKRIAAACSFITKAAGCGPFFAQAFGISHSLFSNPLLQ
ncbi:MAG: hypothetical protein ACLT49_02040 [Sutterella wadsworthensis]